MPLAERLLCGASAEQREEPSVEHPCPGQHGASVLPLAAAQCSGEAVGFFTSAMDELNASQGGFIFSLSARIGWPLHYCP